MPKWGGHGKQDILEVFVFRLPHLYEWMVFASLDIDMGMDLLLDNLVHSHSPPLHRSALVDALVDNPAGPLRRTHPGTRSCPPFPQDRSAEVDTPRDKVMFFAGSMSSPRDHVNDGTGRGGAYVYYGNDTRYLIAAKVGPGSRSDVSGGSRPDAYKPPLPSVVIIAPPL